MDRACIHEGIRWMRFEDVLGRSERSELSQIEAPELTRSSSTRRAASRCRCAGALFPGGGRRRRRPRPSNPSPRSRCSAMPSRNGAAWAKGTAHLPPCQERLQGARPGLPTEALSPTSIGHLPRKCIEIRTASPPCGSGRLSEHGYASGLFVCAAARRSLARRRAAALSNIVTAWLWPARL